MVCFLGIMSAGSLMVEFSPDKRNVMVRVHPGAHGEKDEDRTAKNM